jgi:hypothetical protein
MSENKLPSLQLPTYEMTLPSSGKRVKFRPFVVKEEKILLLAIQEGNSERVVQAIKQIITDCTLGSVNYDDLALVDVEMLFVQIRNKSMGEGVEVKSTCVHCKHENAMVLNLEGVKCSHVGEKLISEVRLGEKEWVIMTLPTVANTYKLTKDDSEEAVFETVASCIKSLVIGEKSVPFSEFPLAQRIEWVMNLTQKQLEAINAYFASIPKIVFDQDFVCVKCKGNNHIHLEGLQNFFD